jgi:hypothetical protein
MLETPFIVDYLSNDYANSAMNFHGVCERLELESMRAIVGWGMAWAAEKGGLREFI